MRLFVALLPPAEVVAALPAMPRNVRPVPPRHVHLTLAFLGEQPSADPVATSLDQAVSGAAPVLQLAGAGAFGNAVWLGLRGDLGRLAELAERVQHAVRAAGVTLEPRRWTPHVTLGRGTLPVTWVSHEGPSASWTEVRLVRSQFDSRGARHDALTSWQLREVP